MTVTFVTLRCAGSCADVEAVATGGNPPYDFSWEDGTTSATRQVCPTSSTRYSVTVSDTGTTGELGQPSQTVQVPLSADVIACPDGGALDGGPFDCTTILTSSAVSAGPGSTDGGPGYCSASVAALGGISAAVSLTAGEEYELVEDATGSALLLGSAPTWSYYASSSDCHSALSGQPIGSMTFDPSTPIQSLCFRAGSDYTYIDWFTSSVAAGIANGTWRLCRGCGKSDGGP
jgi:hypothetical protein